MEKGVGGWGVDSSQLQICNMNWPSLAQLAGRFAARHSGMEKSGVVEQEKRWLLFSHSSSMWKHLLPTFSSSLLSPVNL